MATSKRNIRSMLAKQLDGVFHTARKRTSFSAFLGDGESNLLAYDPDGNVIPGYVMARIQFNDETSVSVRRVRCDKVVMQYGLPVIVAYGRDGDLEVVETDPTTALAFAGGRGAQVGSHNWTHIKGGPDPIFLDGLNFKPFMVMPTNPPSLSIQVNQTHYVYGGAQFLSPDDLVDLTADVPTDDSQQSIVVVAINPATNTLETFISTPTTMIAGGGETMPFTQADVAAVAVTAGHWRLAAFRLYAGMTTIRWSDFITSLQQYGDASASGFLPSFGTTGPGFLHQASSGAAVTILKHKLDATTSPTTGDDDADGYAIGSLWIDITADEIWMARDVSTGAADWAQLDGAGGSAGELDDLSDVAITASAKGDLLTAQATDDWINVNVTDESVVARIGGGNVAPIAVAASRIIGRGAAGSVAALTASQAKTILAIAVADISDISTTYVAQATYDANTILKADSDNTPVALTMGASTILARLAAGNIVAATPTEIKTLLAIDHGADLAGLSDDDHTQYALLAGRSGGQTLIGDTASGGNLVLNSTAHATKGNVNIGGTTLRVNEAAQSVGIGTATSTGLKLYVSNSLGGVNPGTGTYYGTLSTLSLGTIATGTSAPFMYAVSVGLTLQHASTHSITAAAEDMTGGRFNVSKIGTGTSDNLSALVASLNLTTGTISGIASGLYVLAPTTGATITTLVGVRVGDITGATTNEAIRTGKGTVTLGDKATITGWQDVVQLLVKGNGTQTSDLLQVQKSDATTLILVNNSGDLTAARHFLPKTDNTSDIGTTAIGVKNAYISTAILPVTDNAVDLGSTTKTVRAIYNNAEYLVERSAPSTPGSGLGVVYVKTDGLIYFKNDGGTEYDLTSGGSGGATTALDNLASVAINTSLISDTDNTDDLGSSAKKWANAFTNALILEERSAPGTPSSGDLAAYADANGNPRFIADTAMDSGFLFGHHDDAVSLTMSTSEQAVAQKVIKANSIGTKGYIITEAWFLYLNNSGSSRTYTITYNFGTYAFAVAVALTNNATSRHPVHIRVVTWNDQATNAQKHYIHIEAPATVVAAETLQTPTPQRAWGSSTQDSTTDLTANVTVKVGAANVTQTTVGAGTIDGPYFNS